MAQHTNYWSCSSFADWLRGTAKLKAGTSDEWNDWDQLAKQQHPIRYWIAEEGLDYLQDIVTWPVRKLYDIKYYINNRWVTRTHSLTAHPRDIRPGQWCDVGNRFLPCLFNELVDYVEVELAWWHIAWDPEARQQFQAPWYSWGWFRWRTWRSAAAGLANLEWQRKLVWREEEVGADSPDIGKPTHQAINAQEILDLYTWWKQVYPRRPDPYEASGWTEYCEAKRELNDGRLFGGKETTELKKQGDKALKLVQKIEKQYANEDEQMMIRLIKIRDSLWT